MMEVKKLKLKPPVIKVLKVLGIILGIIIFLFCFYQYQIHDLTSLGYSKKASQEILLKFKKSYVLKVGRNKTLNAAFESSSYQEKNLDSYSKISYQNQKHLIENINKLIKKKYSNSEISMILSHGNDKDVVEFAKRDKIKYLEEFYTYDFAKLRNYDRYVAYSDLTGEDEETTVIYVNLDLDKEPYQDPTVISDFDEKVLVTKHYSLSKKYVPDNLVEIPKQYTIDDNLKNAKVAVDAYIDLSKAAEKDGYEVVIKSAYRSYDDQQEVCDTYQQLYGDGYVERYVAKAGFSEHQTGLSFDIGSRKKNVFSESKEYGWMQENAYKYGFIQRFPKGYEDITGFRSEVWHYRYVGKKIAKDIYENKMSYDEYYVRFLDKN